MSRDAIRTIANIPASLLAQLVLEFGNFSLRLRFGGYAKNWNSNNAARAFRLTFCNICSLPTGYRSLCGSKSDGNRKNHYAASLLRACLIAAALHSNTKRRRFNEKGYPAKISVPRSYWIRIWIGRFYQPRASTTLASWRRRFIAFDVL